MNEIVNQLKERISNFSITAMFPSLQYILSEGWNAQTGFVDEESEELFEQMVDVAERFVACGDKTGIPHYILFWSAVIVGSNAERQEEHELQTQCLEWADKYIHESTDLNFNLAYYELGYQLFHGTGIWDKDEETGLALMKKALALPTPVELGADPEFISTLIKNGYDECLADYSSKNQSAKEKIHTHKNVVTTQKKKNLKIKKEFTAKYYIACLAAFVGYILVSIIIRDEFGLKSAYDISMFNNPLLGIGVTLILNYSIIPLLLMAYFYKKNNGKHSMFFVCLYVLFLVLCLADGMIPYIKIGMKLSDVILYPAVFLVAHRLLSLIIYAIISCKEGESDYKIYFGLALFAPFMAWILLIGIVFWIFNGSSRGGISSSESYSANVQDAVRGELSVGVRTTGVYYEDGWKVVDYWNNSSSLSEVEGNEWGHTYFKDSDGKIYDLSTNCPDKETIYYFN